mgnify:CR=1 FL=1
MVNKKDCIFCNILKGKAPCTKIYEDKKTFSFLDINPVVKGHTLVIPKKHYETMDQMDKETANAVISTTQKIGKAILKFNEGYNVNQNNNSAAGQLVPHVHYHVIPRNEGDKLKCTWENLKLTDEEVNSLKQKIIKLLK